MTSKKWKERIVKQMEQLNINYTTYIPAIETLSEILEQRDKTKKEFLKDGGQSVKEYTNKAGATNLIKNPLLILWDDLNKSALAYWREMGLTPSSYKKMMGDTQKQEKQSSLAEALSSIEAS